MKRINLINAHSAQEHYAIARWFSLSIASALLLILTMTGICLYQVVALYSTKSTYQKARKRWAPQLAALHEHTQLKEKIAQLQKTGGNTNRMNNPLLVINSCTGRAGTCIEHFWYGKGTCELQLSCPVHGAERELLTAITAHPLIKNAAIQSIKQKNDDMQLVTIKATVG